MDDEPSIGNDENRINVAPVAENVSSPVKKAFGGVPTTPKAMKAKERTSPVPTRESVIASAIRSFVRVSLLQPSNWPYCVLTTLF